MRGKCRVRSGAVYIGIFLDVIVDHLKASECSAFVYNLSTFGVNRVRRDDLLVLRLVPHAHAKDGSKFPRSFRCFHSLR